MESNKNSQKILILGLILLIIAGMIVVSLKGFNVSFLFGKHEAIELKFDTEIPIKTIEQISQEVFQDKQWAVKKLEVFGDSVQINVASITDEEKANLINQINEKLGTDKTLEDLKITSVSNKRIRDVFKPYIQPMLLSFGIVFIYMLVRFRKINGVKIILVFLAKVILTEVILFCVVAILRIPVSDLFVNVAMIIAVAELVWAIAKCEEKLELKQE